MLKIVRGRLLTQSSKNIQRECLRGSSKNGMENSPDREAQAQAKAADDAHETYVVNFLVLKKYTRDSVCLQRKI